MTRKSALVLVLLVVAALLMPASVAQVDEPIQLRATFGDGTFMDGPGPVTVDTIPPTTSSTTTTQPTTTTTLPPVPDYIDLGTLQSGEGWEIEINNIDDPNTSQVEPSFGWFKALYFFDLPYEDGYGWPVGDRCAYRGAYGFLMEDGTLVQRGAQWDLDGGDLIGRVTFSRTGGYIQVADGFMREGVRHYDGTLDVGPQEPGFNECPEPDIEYEPYTGPDQRPVIAFRNGAGEVVEVRSYPHTQIQHPSIKFQLVDSDGSDGRVAVAAYSNDLPGVVVYYDALGAGTVEAFIP